MDTGGDNRADLAFSFVFSEPDSGRQTVTVHRAAGDQARGHAAGGQAVVSDAAVAFGAEPNIAESGGYASPRACAATRSSRS
ncbi:hypothetical protein AB0953_31935 [Streptomyces sp. NPDC046866]|uniref:hypothetical protein n=1 Tax=Streptomyces sp. NPDC046866 TaxID=3154921 RepID=UPI0034545D8B